LIYFYIKKYYPLKHRCISKVNRLKSVSAQKAKANETKKMSIYGSELHKDGRNLFENNDLQKEDWEALSFVTKTNAKNDKEIVGIDYVYDYDENDIIENQYINEYIGIDVLYEIKRIKKTLEMMKEDLQEYNDEDGKYLRFDTGKYYIGENRNWIYEYEINEYYKIIEKN